MNVATRPEDVVHRLEQATNQHDLAGIAACFSVDYRNETPAHPARGFVGRDQVRANWEQILRFVPDLTARLVRLSVDADTVWTEWEHQGTRLDGSEHAMRGVVILGVADNLITWARFYLEPVGGSEGVDEAVLAQVARAAPPGGSNS